MKDKEEKLMYEQKYNSLQEEVEEQREVVRELRDRYQGALQEIKDLEEENEGQHADLLNDLRDTQQELGLMRGLVDVLLSGHELQKIRMKCKYEEDKGEWSIPPFFMKNKEVQLPALGAV